MKDPASKKVLVKSGELIGEVEAEAIEVAQIQEALARLSRGQYGFCEECEEFNGCQWAGYFAFLDGQQSPEWVAAHDIAAVHVLLHPLRRGP